MTTALYSGMDSDWLELKRLNAYKGIISLNNTGVNLLNRKRYVDSADTLKDAIRLMKASFSYDDRIIPSQASLYQALQDANRRLFAKIPVNTQTPYESDLFILTDEANPYMVYENINKNPKTKFCILIEPMDYICDIQDKDRLDAESAILLFNYAIAYYCSAEESQPQESQLLIPSSIQYKLCQSAVHILKLVQSMVAELFVRENDIVSTKNLLISLLPTAMLLYMPMQTQEHYHRFSEDFENLHVTMSSQHVSLHLYNPTFTASAA